MHSKNYKTYIMINDKADAINAINVKRVGSNIDFLDWIRKQEATINPVNKKDNTCFQYTVKVALNHEEIKEKQKLNLL